MLAACDDDDTAETTATTGATGTTAASAAKDFGGRTITTAVYAKNHASSPLFWQQFAPPGLKVDVKIVTSAGDVNRFLTSGELDFGLMGYYNTIIEAAGGNLQAKVISMCSRQGVGLIARKDRGIRTVADLNGKRVAVPPPGVQTLLLTAALEKVGLGLDRDVTAVPLGYADHPGALERGDVDAYIGTEPQSTQSVVDGVGIRLTEVYDTPAGDINTAMWASPKNLGDPDLLRAVVKMQRDAAEFLTPNGVNSAAEWRKLLVDQFGYTEEVYKGALENIGAEWRFDDKRRRQFEGAADLMLAQGVITTRPNVPDLFALDYLPSS